MSKPKDNAKMGKERCEQCIHWVGALVADPGFGECINNESDHFGHVVSFGHPACEKIEE